MTTTAFAIYFTKPDTTLTFWLNKFSYGGHIWSLVRTRQDDADYSQRWNQPPLQFATADEAQAFIASALAGCPLARVAQVAR